MDMSIKSLDPAVAARLAEQAAAEGLSQQEWVRRILRTASARLSPTELVSQRAKLDPMTDEQFAGLRKKVSDRRRGAVQNLNASRRRR